MQKQQLEILSKEVIRISTEIGKWMKQQTSFSETNAEIKSLNNLVTAVDKESERRFVEALSTLLPDSGFIAEEGSGKEKKGGLNWIIDPLDGTTNFVHSVPVWCTSVALSRGKDILLGVIFDPNSGECFSAYKGGGAYLNGRSICVSTIPALEQSLLATGFPYDDFGRENAYLNLFQVLTHKTRGLRRLGSAALDMAWTACGRFEAFYEYGLNPWDVAAGAIIVTEAGGRVSEFNGNENPVFGEDIICSNGKVHSELIELIGQHFR